MKPDLDRFLEVAMMHLMATVGPALGPGYEQSNTMVLGVMLGAVREELDRAAARRFEENAALRALFAEVGPGVGEAALAARLEAAAATEEPSLLVSDLERSNSELRALLIELHAHVETLQTPEAHRIEEAIWRELVISTQRRALAMGPF